MRDRLIRIMGALGGVVHSSSEKSSMSHSERARTIRYIGSGGGVMRTIIAIAALTGTTLAFSESYLCLTEHVAITVVNSLVDAEFSGLNYTGDLE